MKYMIAGKYMKMFYSDDILINRAKAKPSLLWSIQ